MSPQVPIEMKQRLCDLFLQFDSLDNQNSRNLYVSELNSQLGQPLNHSRHSESMLDVWSLINACLSRPGALGTFTRIVRSFHKNSYWMADLERLVAEIERQTLLTAQERANLVELVAETAPEDIATAYGGLPDLLDGYTPEWTDQLSVVAAVEAASETRRDPLTLLSFADALAHLSSRRTARQLHAWVDVLGVRLCFDQGTVRGLCLRSRETLSTNSEEPLREGGDSADQEAAPDTVAESPGDNVRTAHDAPRTGSEPATMMRIWGVGPLRNPNFTGRAPLLRQLRDELVRHKKTSVLPQTLHGFGGVGKTQLAVEYVYRFGDQYDLVSSIPAERRTDVLASLASLGERLTVAASEDMEQHARTVVDALGTLPYRWLLVYDNADHPDDLNRLVPSAGGHVILTSRNADWANDKWRTIEVDVFERGESIELLNKRDMGIPEETADRLAERSSATFRSPSNRRPISRRPPAWPSGNTSSCSMSGCRTCSPRGSPRTIPQLSPRFSRWRSTGSGRRLRQRRSFSTSSHISALSRFPRSCCATDGRRSSPAS